ncbi:MAG: nitrous oxide-stimulated promoter family protein [Treponema sp.]|nr:nitrous oxide-stimulated promoter family protein [Treponema sp.]
MTKEAKIKREQNVVKEMILLYCRKNHSGKNAPCKECAELISYAQDRSAHCPFMKEKTFCSNCKVHCYKPEMRKKIKTVMRFSGPRMLIYHPFMAIWHMITFLNEKRRLRRNNEYKSWRCSNNSPDSLSNKGK